MTNQLRWGFLSAAEIAKKNWQAIALSPNAKLTAVASRSKDKAAAFIDECSRSCFVDERPNAIGSYEELLASDTVDAVYIPLPTGLRKDWVIKAAQAGKHVMCEKPCAIAAADLEDMIAACNENNVQFMDGVMFMHNKRMDKMRECLDRGDVGTIKRIATQFSFLAPEDFLSGNIRVNSDLEPQGCLGDLGWYTIRFTLWAMNYQTPTQVTGRLLSEHGAPGSPNSVPTEFSGELLFEDGVSASFYNAFVNEHQQWANISGTKGNLHVADFVLPYFGNEQYFDIHNAAFSADGCQFNMERHTQRHVTAEFSNNAPDAQETTLFTRFSELALSGTPDNHWPEISLKTQRVMDACLESARNENRPVTL
ncbi:MAG: Gfo/Idh/MocA family protein [Planctomycetaceae bacterium]